MNHGNLEKKKTPWKPLGSSPTVFDPPAIIERYVRYLRQGARVAVPDRSTSDFEMALRNVRHVYRRLACEQKQRAWTTRASWRWSVVILVLACATWLFAESASPASSGTPTPNHAAPGAEHVSGVPARNEKGPSQEDSAQWKNGRLANHAKSSRDSNAQDNPRDGVEYVSPESAPRARWNEPRKCSSLRDRTVFEDQAYSSHLLPLHLPVREVTDNVREVPHLRPVVHPFQLAIWLPYLHCVSSMNNTTTSLG
jgi:hypothetical protein